MKDISSERALKASDRFINNIKSGNIKKRILPNTGTSFDDEKSFKSFQKSCQDQSIKELAKKIYE